MPRIDLPERPTDRKSLEGWYSTALQQEKARGLSVAALAKELGVTATTLYQWRRRLSGKGRRRRARTGPTGLVEVTVDRAAPGAGAGTFVVRLAGDRRIEVPGTFEDVALRRLIAVLESC
jgi:transcriptional regulator with XRE-family HTH domain